MRRFLCARKLRCAFVAAGIVVLASLGAAPASAKMLLQNFEAEDNYRFYVAPGGGPVKSFIGAPFNSSGVGRSNSNRWLTMISPTYGVSANHFFPGDSKTVRFYHSDDPNGDSETRTVASSQQIGGSDLRLVKLTASVSSSVRKYSVLGLSNDSSYDDLEIYTYGKNVGSADTSQRLGRNNIDSGSIAFRTVPDTVSGTTGMSFTYDYDSVGGQGDNESYLHPGDSGGPSFVINNGKFALVGVHWFKDPETGTPVKSGDTFIPHYISALNTAMVGESVTVVPEPSASILAILSLLAIAFGTGTGRMRRTR